MRLSERTTSSKSTPGYWKNRSVIRIALKWFNNPTLALQDRIDSITSNIKASEEFANEEERNQQIEEVQEMVCEI